MYRKGFLLFVSVISYISLGAMSLIEHPNITFQKNFEHECNTIFAQELCDNPHDLSERFKNALTNNSHLLYRPFFLGASSSAYQFEGGIGEECSWHRFALKKGLALPGDACNFWNDYPRMIKQMKEELGINSFRLSIAWERIQKTKGVFDFEAVAHYRKIIQELKKYDIEPLVVFNHYTIPTWFEDMGGFEREENIQYFVDFAKEVYCNLADLVTYWSTFNAVEGYAFKGYYTLEGPPGKNRDLQLTVDVMLHMLQAHVAVYRALKGIQEEGSTGLWQRLQNDHPDTYYPCPQIGIQKNVLFLDVAYDTAAQILLAPLTWFLCSIGNKMQDNAFYNFFTKGLFTVYVPFQVSTEYYDAMAPYTLDWIGVNTYANQKRHLMNVIRDTDISNTTLNKNYRYYPQSVYRAVKTVHKRINNKKNKKGYTTPIWLTENGIAAHSDAQRQQFFQKTLLFVTKLIEEQYPLIGYTPWASHDNYEWGAPLGEKRYGMFYVDFDDLTKPHILKEGSQYFANFVKNALNRNIIIQ